MILYWRANSKDRTLRADRGRKKKKNESEKSCLPGLSTSK